MVGEDTIAAIATAPGRGAVAIVRMSGGDAFRIASALSGGNVSAADAGRFRRVPVSSPSGERIDDAVMLVFAAPRSYTGEDVVEFQCHGGTVVPRRVLEACLSAGARLAERGEFTKRAFLSGRLDLDEADAVIDLIDSKTDRAAGHALARLEGKDSGEIEAVYSEALELSATAEHALDFDDGELPDDFLQKLSAGIGALQARIASVMASVRKGELLGSGAKVVLVGPPNAGKSSLLNALLGTSRAIVSPTAGTTRDSIEETLDIGGWPVRLADTAGLRRAADGIEREGIERALSLANGADLAIFLRPCGETERRDAFAEINLPEERIIRIRSKCDLPGGAGPDEGALRVSARSGEGLDALRAAVAERLETLSAERGEHNGADAFTRRRAALEEAARSVEAARRAEDPELAANGLRNAAEALGRMLGRVWTDDLLDSVFSRFCVGK